MGNIPSIGSALPQPGASGRGAAIPSLRPHPAAAAGLNEAGSRHQAREPGVQSKRKRRGTLLGALFMISLALAGTGFFFKDQVSLLWTRTLLKWKSREGGEAIPTIPTTPGAQQTVANQQARPAPTGAGGTPSTFNPNVPAVKVPDPGIQQPVPAPDIAQPSITAKDPVPTPSPLNNGSPQNPPLPVNPTANTGNPAVPANKLDPGTDPGPVRKALPIEQSSSPIPSTIKDNPQTNPATLVEVPGLRDKTTGKVDTYSGDDKIFVSATPDAQTAANVLKQFFSAKTWNERLEYTQAPDKIRPLMERYYEANNDGPLRVSRIELIRHDRAPETGSPHCVFQVSGPAMDQPLPVMVESTSGGWKVDWLTFTEFKDRLLLRFLKSWSDEPGRFHVMMRRTHYFDEDVPDLDKKYCFELTPPEAGMSGFVFVPKGSVLARELDKSLGWEITNVAAVVELQWRKQDRYQWVEMTAVPQYNWRGPASGKSVAAPPAADNSTPVAIEKAKPVEETPPQPVRPRGTKK